MDQAMIDTVRHLGVQVRVMERALHGSENWSLLWRGQDVFLDRAIEGDAIVFWADFPQGIGDAPDGHAYVLIDGDAVLSIPVAEMTLDPVTISFRLRPSTRLTPQT